MLLVVGAQIVARSQTTFTRKAVWLCETSVSSPKELCWGVSCGDQQSYSSRFQLKRSTFARY